MCQSKSFLLAAAGPSTTKVLGLGAILKVQGMYGEMEFSL